MAAKPAANVINEIMPEPFCRCWDSESFSDPGDPYCTCGEEIDVVKWRWQVPPREPKWVEFDEDQRQVIFHPLYSSGTAIVKGDVELKHNMHYYWEVKMLTQPYGTDIMVGVGSKAVPVDAVRQYTTYLGSSDQSYGLSYTGAVCQNRNVIADYPGFCKGTIIGVMVDMFYGTLEFYLNREPQGIVFTDLRRHESLYPMITSTAALSSMKLTYASSWANSLLIHAAKILASSATGQSFFKDMPPGLAEALRIDFWIPLRSGKENNEKRPIRDRIITNRRW